MCFQVAVNPLSGGIQTVVKVCDNIEELKKMNVLQLKKKINERLGTGDDLRLIFNSKPLEDEAPLESTGIKHMSTVETVVRVNGGA